MDPWLAAPRQGKRGAWADVCGVSLGIVDGLNARRGLVRSGHRRLRRMRRGVALALIVLAASAGWIAFRDWRRGYESTRGATVTRFTVRSALVGRDLHEVLVVPAGDERGRALLVFLHGRSSAPDSNLRQPLFDALRDLGPRAPVVLLADGGDHSYWHDRRDGKWGASVLREAIPAALSRSACRRRPCRDRRHFDGRLRGARYRASRPGALLRGRRALRSALVPGRRHTREKDGAARSPRRPVTPDAAGMVAVSPVATERSL